MHPNLPAYSLEQFLKGIDGITIYHVTTGGAVEAFIDFMFCDKKFTAHLNVDQWIFTENEPSVTEIEFANMVDHLERINKNKIKLFFTCRI